MPNHSGQRKPSMMENVQTVNSAVRTVLMVCVASCVGFGGWLGYSEYIVPGLEGKQAKEDLVALQAKYDEIGLDLKEASIENDKLRVSLDLLKIDRRVAKLTVNKKGVDENGQKYLDVTFSEIDTEGKVIGSSREFTLLGDTFFVDCWVAKFEDQYVEQADPLRGASIFTFKRIYGDEMKPADGFSLDDFSKPTGVYARSEASQFAQQIWQDFGNVCNDRSRQDELGIRAASGQAMHLPPKEGQSYEITIRSSGGVNLRALPTPDSL
jgi:hypothetical protein